MHYTMRRIEICDHKDDAQGNGCDGDNIRGREHRAFYQNISADRNTDNARCNAWYIFANIERMTDVNEEVYEQCQKYSVPQAVNEITREAVCEKTDSEKRNKLFIYGQSKAFIGKSAVCVHDLWKSFEKPWVLTEEPPKSGDFFHVVKYEYQR